MKFDQWFQSQQGKAYYSYYEFAKDAWDYQQSVIDAIMLEYCPEEMTWEQIEEWKKHQKVVED